MDGTATKSDYKAGILDKNHYTRNMATTVLTIDSEYESAKRLGYPTHTCLGDYAYKFDNDVIIRWGNSRQVYTRDGSRSAEFACVINSAKAIRQNCQKHQASKLLAQVVNIPTLWEKKVPKGALAVVRPIEHSAGSEFSVQKGPFAVKPGTYATRFIKTDREYRVWFCGDKTMVGRRVKMQCNEEQEYPCRSNWGYEFCDGISLELHHQTLMAAKKIGLEVGAADVLYFKGQWLFLELNSAASVDHRVVREFFQVALEELIKKKVKEYQDAKQQAQSQQSQTSPVAAVVEAPIQPVNVAQVAEALLRPAVGQPVGLERAASPVQGNAEADSPAPIVSSITPTLPTPANLGTLNGEAFVINPVEQIENTAEREVAEATA